MSDAPKELSPKMQALAQAIRDRQTPPQVVFCGFDMWLEVCGSGHTSTCNFKAGGEIATGNEPEHTVIVPVLVIGRRIVVGFDPTLPPGEFVLKP